MDLSKELLKLHRIPIGVASPAHSQQDRNSVNTQLAFAMFCIFAAAAVALQQVPADCRDNYWLKFMLTKPQNAAAWLLQAEQSAYTLQQHIFWDA